MRRTGTVLLRNSARMSSSPICSSSVFFRSLDTLASSRMVGWNVFSVLPSDFTAWWGTTHASARGRHADGGHAAGAGHTSASPLGPNTMRATTPTSSASGAPTPKKDACTRCGRGGARSATPRTAWQPAARHRDVPGRCAPAAAVAQRRGGGCANLCTAHSSAQACHRCGSRAGRGPPQAQPVTCSRDQLHRSQPLPQVPARRRGHR